jgi:hypothetical protein
MQENRSASLMASKKQVWRILDYYALFWVFLHAIFLILSKLYFHVSRFIHKNVDGFPKNIFFNWAYQLVLKHRSRLKVQIFAVEGRNQILPSKYFLSNIKDKRLRNLMLAKALK